MKKITTLALLLIMSTIVFAQPCSSLFFSEYVEGSANNKALEIFNPTPNTIDLSNYRVLIIGYTNAGNALSGSFDLSGTIAPGAVVILSNSQATLQSILGNTTFSVGLNNNVTSFTGDDAILLLNGSDTLDIIGEIGSDPGGSWIIGNDSTQNKTLVRNASINEGTKDWSLRENQWNILAIDITQLGSHTMTPCTPPADTIANFSPIATTVSEGAGTYNLTVNLNQVTDIQKTVDISLATGNAADVGNFTTATLTFAPSITSQSVTITITDNAVVDGNRTVTFSLSNPSTGLLLGNASFTLNIADNEVAPTNVLPISVLRTVNSDGIPDSIGITCEVRGTVLGINNRSAAIQFSIYDGTGGIGVFSPGNNFGYTVTEGDSIVVIGEVGQFNGLTQMIFLDTVYKVGTGNLPIPQVVATTTEEVESELIRINNVTITNLGDWNNANAAGFTVDAISGGNTFEIRIDEQTALYNQPAPTGAFDIIGIGGQFDSNPPHTSFYSIAPRYISDIMMVSGITEKNKGVVNLIVYPNPAANTAIIKFDAENTNSNVAVTVYDLAGKVVLNTITEIVNGSNLITLSTISLVNGSYVVEVSGASLLAKERLMILK